MAPLVESRLKSLGFATERHKKMAGAGADIVVGKLQGAGQKKFMLQAQMDTVYQSGILSTQGYKVDGNQIYGPGIADDKGGIAVILHSLAIPKDKGWKDFSQITVMFNPDEEVAPSARGNSSPNWPINTMLCHRARRRQPNLWPRMMQCCWMPALPHALTCT